VGSASNRQFARIVYRVLPIVVQHGANSSHDQLAQHERVLPAERLRLPGGRVVDHQQQSVGARRRRRVNHQRHVLAHALASQVKLDVVETDYRGHAMAVARSAARDGIDLVVSPTQAMTPPLIGVDTVPFAGRDEHVTSAMCETTAVFNVLGWPAISVPCGTDRSGLPVGCQIAALPWREVDCLAAAAVVEAAMPSR